MNRLLKMMIVDDEPLVRLALQHMIDWPSMGIVVEVEAADGAEALEILKQRGDIDLMLLDIEMPRLSGIELLRAYSPVMEKRRPVTIMLSAYSDYSYVREAFLLGAIDFIVKADMDEEHLVPVILKAVNELSKEEPPLNSLPTSEIEDDIDAKSEILRQLITFDPNQQEEAVALATIGIHEWLGEVNQLVAVMTVSQGSGGSRQERNLSDAKTQRFITQSVQTVLDAMSIRHFIYRKSQTEYVLFCTLVQYRSESVIREKVQSAFTMMQTRLIQYVNVSISIGVSELASGTKHWYRLHQQAAHLAAMSFFAGWNKVFYPESCMDQGRSGSGVGAGAGGNAGQDHVRKLQLTLKANGAAITQLLEQDNSELWGKEFEQMQLLLGQTWGWRPQDVQAALENLLWELGGLLHRKGIRWDELEEELQHPFEYMRSLETLEETKRWLHRICTNLYSWLHGKEKADSSYSTVVATAKQFLDLHYMEDVNLALISEMVGVSESYLSKQFTKEVGSNFIQYLTNLRIEESKRLMKKKGFKITDIAESVGYLNVEHFSRMFKKTTGYSPKLYRESLLK
ncbi:response regulator transcription factor [Paenibacillus anseongense]|uniref:response regulator transcription factor n=1 Tax=Paenibacillus anseongense TaxID=2682845 RepID=UPI002DBF20C0|nr:helix-turn-helix domain-containing protein [Paenibacillus anseongense]MEC0267776.1 response regulator [Paenibacillus anseongense]